MDRNVSYKLPYRYIETFQGKKLFNSSLKTHDLFNSITISNLYRKNSFYEHTNSYLKAYTKMICPLKHTLASANNKVLIVIILAVYLLLDSLVLYSLKFSQKAGFRFNFIFHEMQADNCNDQKITLSMGYHSYMFAERKFLVKFWTIQ